MVLEPDLELLAARRDPALPLELDALDLAIRPGVDALDVILGELAQLFGLDRLTSADRVDMRLAALLGLLGVARLLGGCRRLHRLGELREELPTVGRAVTAGAEATRVRAVRAERR